MASETPDKSNYDQIGILWEKVEKLVSVRYSVFDAGTDGLDWIEAIEMRFEHSVATIYVEADFDTLRLELSDMKIGSDSYAQDATSLRPWQSVLNRPLSWIWVLTNQQGYEDGFRFEFAMSEGEKVSGIITLIGIASSIQIFSSESITFQ